MHDLAQFETFLRVVEMGSFTEAAKVLGVTKAAVSQAVRQLENALKINLLIRSTRSIRMTPEGELLFEQCKRLQRELDGARNLVSHFGDSPTGTLRVSCNTYFSKRYLIPIIKAYREQFPKVEIELIAEERMPDLHKEQIDIVFGVNWPAPDDVVAKPVAKTRYIICASPEYLKTYGEPKTLKDLEDHIYIPHMGRTPENIIANMNQPVQAKLNMPLKMNNAVLMKRCALMGLGIIQLHGYMVEAEIARGELVELLRECGKSETPLYMYYVKDRFVQPKIRQFVNLVDNIDMGSDLENCVSRSDPIVY